MKRLFFIFAAVLCLAANIWAGEPRYEIRSVLCNVDATENNVHGLSFFISAEVYDNSNGMIICDGDLLLDADPFDAWEGVVYNPDPQDNRAHSKLDLRSESGDIVHGKTKTTSLCESDDVIKSFRIFIPHSVITHPAGHVKYQFSFTIRNAFSKESLKNKAGGYNYDFPFSLDWPEEWPKKVRIEETIVEPKFEQKEEAKKEPKAQKTTQTKTQTTSTKTATSDYVDLGLPSGTLWKNKNEVETMIGFNYFSHIELDKMLDDCCVPTKEQFEELVQYCTWKWDGKGYTITGKNGKRIYLPAAGHSDFQRFWYGGAPIADEVGVHGYYWTSTRRDSGNDENYLALVFSSDVTHTLLMPFKKNTFISVRLVR